MCIACTFHSDEKKQLETNAYKEVTVMKKLSAIGNLNVIHLVGCIRYPAAIVMEYAPLGNLYDYLNKYKNAVSVCEYCMGQCIRIHAVYMIVLHFITGLHLALAVCILLYMYYTHTASPWCGYKAPSQSCCGEVSELLQHHHSNITGHANICQPNCLRNGKRSKRDPWMLCSMHANEQFYIHLFNLCISEFVASMNCVYRHLTPVPLPHVNE